MIASASYNAHTAQNKQLHIAIDLSINSCGSLSNFAVQTLNDQLSERFTDHQSEHFSDN